jgi:hypothetical protein
MALQAIKTALDATSIPFADTAWSTAPDGTYGVYQVDFGGVSLWGDGERLDQVIHGSVDVFVPISESVYEAVRSVESALGTLESVGWQFNSKQYERDTKLTHLEWVFESVETDVMSDGEA